MNRKIRRDNTKLDIDRYIRMSAIDSANQRGQAMVIIEEIGNNL